MPRILAHLRPGRDRCARGAVRGLDVAPGLAASRAAQISSVGRRAADRRRRCPARASALMRTRRCRRRPSVVNIFTTKEFARRVTRCSTIRIFRRFFGELPSARRSARVEPRLRRDRQRRRLRAHQPPRGRSRGRHRGRARRRPAAAREGGRHRSRDRPRGAEDRRATACRRSPSATPTRCRSATWCSRSATRSASARR